MLRCLLQSRLLCTLLLYPSQQTTCFILGHEADSGALRMQIYDEFRRGEFTGLFAKLKVTV